jgi:hypothetical protein
MLFIKRLSFMLTVLLVSGMIASCGQPASSDESVTTAESAITTSVLDTLPKENLNGITVRALARKSSWWQLSEISYKELNGEVINDAVYNRNLKLETQCNIKFVAEHVDSVGTVIRALILSNDDQYDFVMPNMSESATLAAEDMFLNLNNISSLDLTQGVGSERK